MGLTWAWGAASGSATRALKGSNPSSAGLSRISTATKGITSSATPATKSTAVRQPRLTISEAMAGRKSSWPVAALAVSAPITRPRRSRHQRLETIATRAMVMLPVPMPTTNPHSATICQAARITVVAPTPRPTRLRASARVRRPPKRSISAAANGPHRP